MAPVKPVTRSRSTSFTWNGDTSAIRTPLSQWTDHEGSNGSSADDFSDVPDSDDRRKHHGAPLAKTSYASYMSDVGECDDRKRFSNSFVKASYDSDSCLTPRSRRTLRRTLSGVTEPWPSVQIPSKPALDTIFSPTHEILHPLQSLRREKSFSERAPPTSARRVFSSPAITPNSGRVASFKLPKPQPHPSKIQAYKLPEPKREYHSVALDSYASPKPRLDFVEFESYTFPKPLPAVATTVEEEKLEQKQSLIRGDSDDVHHNSLKGTKSSNIVVIIVDAEKKPALDALDWAINGVVQPGDEIVILGVLKHISSPMGYKMVANTDPLYGVNTEILQSEVNKTSEVFENKLSDSGRRDECEKKNVKVTVRIAPGARARTVVVRELAALGATYAIFDRKAMRSRRYYGKHLSCHAVRMRKNGSSTKTITLVAKKDSRSPTSDISSVSSMSTDRASSEAPSSTFWRRITSFRSRRRSRTTTSPRSSSGSPRSDLASPLPSPSSAAVNDADSDMSEMQGHFNAPLALQPFVPADAYTYRGTTSHRKQHRRAISVSIPQICIAT